MDRDIVVSETTNDYSSYWQSIPDPPSPSYPTTAAVSEGCQGESIDDQDLENSRRRRKRQSMAPLRDVTNRNATQYCAMRILAVKSNEIESIYSELDGIDKNQPSARKRLKKRRITLLPSTISRDLLSGIRKSPIIVEKKDTSVGLSVRNSAIDKDEECISSHDTTKNHDHIIELVRKYCSLPLIHRVNSQVSKEIERISGYPMPGKIIDIFSGDNDTSKSNFLLRAQPIVQAMEVQKKSEIASTQHFTQCEVRKNAVGGGFEYLDVNLLETVSSEEYKSRYCAMINERREERRAASSSFSNVDGIHATNEKVPDVVDDSNMEVDDSVTSPVDHSRVHPDDDTSQPNQSISTYDDRRQSTLTSPANQHENSSRNNCTTNTRPVLSRQELFPGSTTPSNDTRVLKARQKLWLAIDAALAEYSREVLAYEK